MAETITVPGVGPVNKPMMMTVVAAGAAVVGYLWWQHGRQAPDVDVLPNPDLVPVTDRTPVVGDSTGNWDETAGNSSIDTNAEWTQAATEYLDTRGYDSGTISATLGKFIARQPLTAAEVELVLAAKAAFGDPPIGGPWPVTAAGPGAALTAPKNLRVTGKQKLVSGTQYARADLAWDSVAGAIGYEVRAWDNDEQASAASQDSADTIHLYQPLWAGHSYNFAVAAKDSAGTGPFTEIYSVQMPA